MSLFRILRGNSSKIPLSSTPFHDGYVYLTTDDGGLYVDAVSGDEEKRIRINTPIDDTIPTYTPATENEELVNGEKMNSIMGKIARAISSLIAHITNKSNPHEVTAGQIGALGMEELNEAMNQKADHSTAIYATLLASAWTGTESPFTQTLSIEQLTASGNGTISIASNASSEQRLAARDALLCVVGQEEGKLHLVADGKKPEIDIPVAIILLG